MVRTICSYLYMYIIGTDFVVELMQRLRKYELYLLPQNQRPNRLIDQLACKIPLPMKGPGDKPMLKILESKMDQVIT
jgi:hypothetical protein